MSAKRRLNHDAKTWLNDSEIELLVSFLMRDDRYRDLVIVFPPRITRLFRIAFDFARRRNFLESCLYRHKSENKRKVQDIIKEETKVLEMIQQVISNCASLFSKRLLIFINNERKSHWTCTFVFNAGRLLDQDTVQWSTPLQPSYLYYDPLDEPGLCEKEPLQKNGTFHFLNYTKSILEWQKGGDPSIPLTLVHPFGK